MRLTHRIFLENASCLVALAVLALGACYPIVFFDRVPLATGNILFEPPWEEARPRDLAPLTYPPGEVQARQYYPWYVFLNDAAQYGDSLLWTPFEGCGMPFLALWRSRCLSPFSLPFYFMSTPSRALQVSVLLKLIVAGLCAFYAARKFGFTPSLALFVGVAFEFSAPVFLWIGFPMSDVVPWLPLWLVFAERLLLGQARYWPYGAIVVALMALGGDPESLAASILFVLLFLLVRVALGRKRPTAAKTSTLALLASLGVGAALAAVQLVPYIEFLSEAASTGRSEPTATLRFTDLVLCFLPHFFGKGPEVMTYQGISDNLAVLKLLHFGLIPMMLLPLWFSVRHFVPEFHRHRIDGMLIAASLITILPLAGSGLLPRAPLLGRLNPEHFLIGNALAFAFIAAAAIEEWLELNADQCKGALVRLLLFVPALAAMAILAVWINHDTPRPAAPDFIIQVVIAGGFALALLVLLTGTLFRPSVRVMGYGLSALTFMYLFLAFAPGIVYAERKLLFPQTSSIQALRECRTRLCGGEVLKQWPLAGNLVAQVYCPSRVELKRHAAVIERTTADPLLLRRTGTPALLLTKADIQGAFAMIRPRLEIQHVFSSGAVLLNDLGAKPRAWMAYKGRPVDVFDPALLCADLPPIMEGVALSNPSPGRDARVTISDSERYNRVPVHVEDTRPGVLVLADTWYPGWKATVDGAESPVFPVDGLFRGVEAGEGSHEVLFYYDPYSFKLGRAISAGAALITLIGVGYAAFIRLRSHRKPF